MSLEKKLGNRRSLGFKIATTATAVLMGAMSYVGCRAEPVEYKSVEEVVETQEEREVVETEQNIETIVEEEKNFFENIDENIIFDVHDGMFPESWYEDPINVKATSLPESERARSKEIVINALEKYPVDVINKNLDKVYIISNMSVYGNDTGGTFTTFPPIVYINNSNIEKGFTEEWIIGVFDHEFSTILLRKYKKLFDEEAWRALNPESFKYYVEAEGKYSDYVGSNNQFDILPKYNEIVMACGYSTRSFEDDFNMVAQYTMGRNKEFLEAVEEYPKLKEKQYQFMDFYINIDPEFEELFSDIYKK
jgi:hypothetical protein